MISIDDFPFDKIKEEVGEADGRNEEQLSKALIIGTLIFVIEERRKRLLECSEEEMNLVKKVIEVYVGLGYILDKNAKITACYGHSVWYVIYVVGQYSMINFIVDDKGWRWATK